MSESPVGVQTEVSVSQIKKDLFDPKTISKNNDQEGRNNLAAELREKRQERDDLHKDMATTQTELDDRQSNLLVKLKTKLNIPDKQTQELEVVKLEQGIKDENLPDTRKMVDAYYEKVAETPLTNQEKRDLLKPEVLAQLTTDEYVALWKRLNPHFLTHVTRQGFRDHNAMAYHERGLLQYQNGLLNVLNDEKQLKTPFAISGLDKRDEISIKILLSKWVTQAENQSDAEKRFDQYLHQGLGEAPKYPDKTAVHFASSIVSDEYYGGESGNEVFFVFPTDALASQYNFAFNGKEKDFTRPQSEIKWNDVFVWSNSIQNPEIPVDSGMVFLPDTTRVDPTTGSKYASEMITIDGVEQRVMVEDTDLVNKFTDWSKELTEDSQIIKLVNRYLERGPYYEKQGRYADIRDACLKELQGLGFNEGSARILTSPLIEKLVIWREKITPENFQTLIAESSAKFKLAENTITAKEYWEDYFSKNPNLKPKHVVYYNGDPTSAIYRFQQENNIGSADTSKVDGQLLGFDDHHITDMSNDPRANMGHQELVDLGKKIIAEHYASR